MYCQLMNAWMAFAVRVEHAHAIADGSGMRMLAETVTGGSWATKPASMGTCDENFQKALEELQNTEPDDLHSPTREFVDIVMNICEARRLYRTENGALGLGPSHLAKGDLITVLFGGPTPFILRKQDHRKFRIIGETYLCGAMRGEAIEACELGKHDVEELEII